MQVILACCGYRKNATAVRGRVWLSTFEGLDPARWLYEGHGFRLVETHLGGQWGHQVREQTFERRR